MVDPVLELQGVIIQRLRSFPEVTALIGQRSYDQPPVNDNGEVAPATFPYTSMGPSNIFTDVDTDCVDGMECMVQIDAWSIAPGYPEVRRIADAVRRAFRDYEFGLTENALVSFDHDRTDITKDGDIKHASIRFTALVEQP